MGWWESPPGWYGNIVTFRPPQFSSRRFSSYGHGTRGRPSCSHVSSIRCMGMQKTPRSIISLGLVGIARRWSCIGMFAFVFGGSRVLWSLSAVLPHEVYSKHDGTIAPIRRSSSDDRNGGGCRSPLVPRRWAEPWKMENRFPTSDTLTYHLPNLAPRTTRWPHMTPNRLKLRK